MAALRYIDQWQIQSQGYTDDTMMITRSIYAVIASRDLFTAPAGSRSIIAELDESSDELSHRAIHLCAIMMDRMRKRSPISQSNREKQRGEQRPRPADWQIIIRS